MARRKSAKITNPQPHVPPVLDWEVSESYSWNGRHLSPGTEVSITGERGRFRFVKHVRRPNGVEWVDFVGGPHGQESFRSFRPERIRTVHRIGKSQSALAARYREAQAAKRDAARV